MHISMEIINDDVIKFNSMSCDQLIQLFLYLLVLYMYYEKKFKQ